MEKQGRITTKTCTEESGTTDTMPSCIDAAPLTGQQKNAEVHTPPRESRKSDNQGNRNADVDEGHQGYISPSARNSLNSYYASIFSCESSNPEIQPTQSGNPFTVNISIIRKRLSTLGRKKSVGPDGIPGEILKLGGEAMIPYLA